jgi:hypothetical protein
MRQQEIVDPSPLLDDHGALRQRGWARNPLLDSNLESAHFYRYGRRLQRFRIKRWDYYGATFPGGYFSATLADLGYAGQAFVYMVDFAANTYVEETITIPFARGITLPRNSDSGRSAWQGKRAVISFDVVGTTRTVTVDWANFGGEPLRADMTFDASGESTVVVIPIGERRFYYNRKINCMPVGGTIRVGRRLTQLDPTVTSGTLDWGRGVWEYDSFWVWASTSGFTADGRRVGMNMGFGFGDSTAATENTLILDGRIHKLAGIEFAYDDTDFKRPWTMQSERVDLTFTPLLERTAKTNLLLIRSEVHQMFGHYSGTVVDDDGTEIVVENLTGWAEEHRARW